MRQIIALWLAALMLAAQPLQAAVCVGFGESSGPTCSGDASSGDNESFEKGAGEFCTTDWSESDADGAINTYSSTDKNCGTYSLAITADSDTATNKNRAYIDLGAADSDIYLRYYVKIPSISTNYQSKIISYLSATSDFSSATQVYFIVDRNTSSTTMLAKIRTAGTNPSEYFNVTVGDWYRIEIHSVSGGTSTLRIYTSAGSAVETSSGGGDYVIDLTASHNPRYIIFADKSTESTAATHYIDDVVVDVDGADYIGAETCD